MMAYSDVFTYVDGVSQTYITGSTVAVANAIAPAASALLGLYVILWGVASLRGLIQEPIGDAAVRILKIALIFTLAIKLGHYNEIIVDTFYNGPEQLARMLTGAKDNVSAVAGLDQILESGYMIGKGFWDKGGVVSGDTGMYLVAVAIWGVSIAVTAYAAFLIVLAKIALSIVLSLGPLFIISLLFQPTASYFNGWIQQLSNYAILIILTVAANIFILTLFQRSATGAASISSSGQIDTIIPFLITGVISLLVVAQLPNIAAGLAGGLGLSSYAAGRLGMSVLANTGRRIITADQQRKTLRVERKALRDASPRYIAYENRDQHNQNGIGR